MLMYGRNQHNIIKQFSSNKNLKRKKLRESQPNEGAERQKASQAEEQYV